MDVMKDFLEDLGKQIGQTAEAMASMAEGAIELQKVKSQMKNLARENAVDFMELGRAVYEKFKNQEEVSEEEAGICEAIASREESIAQLQRKAAKLKGVYTCGGCGREVRKGMAYCPFCGTKVEIIEDVEEEEVFDSWDDDFAGDEFAEKMAQAAEETADAAEEAAEETVEEAIEEAVEDAVEEAAEETVEEAAGEAAEKTE